MKQLADEHLNSFPPRYDFSKHGIEVGKNMVFRTNIGTIQGYVRETYRTFFVLKTPAGYQTTISRWHFIAEIKSEAADADGGKKRKKRTVHGGKYHH